jgi:hypothetical protein
MTEDVRIVPVIACAYADELLEGLFKTYISNDVPGGKRALFGPYGPLSDFASRLKLAFVFELASKQLLNDLDRLRSARNQVAHTWDADKLVGYFSKGCISEMFEIEALVVEKTDWFPTLNMPLAPEQAFRIRVAGILTMLTYEKDWYAKAKTGRLRPDSVLFGKNRPRRLTDFSGAFLIACRKLLI